MRLEITRYTLKIVPEDTGFGRNEDKRDTAFIEEVLGLKDEGDSIRLVRRNAHGFGCIAYLDTDKGKRK